MPSIPDTAYPRLKASVPPVTWPRSTPRPPKGADTGCRAETGSHRLGVFPHSLKTFQRLGYFVYVQGPRLDCAPLADHVGTAVDRPISQPMMPRGRAVATYRLSSASACQPMIRTPSTPSDGAP
jgi:hypothetical protein